jgi:hypothetical protein
MYFNASKCRDEPQRAPNEFSSAENLLNHSERQMNFLQQKVYYQQQPWTNNENAYNFPVDFS